MFSDKQRQSWQNIKAPESLLQKTADGIENIGVYQKRGTKRFALSLIAASFILIFAVVFLIGKSNDARIYVDGILLTDEAQTFSLNNATNSDDSEAESEQVAPMALARAVAETSELTLSLDIKGETLIEVSDGYFDVCDKNGEISYTGNAFNAFGSVTIVWTYPLNESEHQLILKSQTYNGTVTVSHDSATAERTITYVKN